MGVESYSTNPDLNTSVNGIDISEGCAPGGFNNALRQFMADMKSFFVTYVNVSYPIAIDKGGTGAVDAAGARSALSALGAEFRHLPQNAKSGAFTLDLTMDGGHVYYTGPAATATVPLNSAVAFDTGSVILLVNDGSGALAIARTGGVSLKWSQTGANADRSLAVGGMATLLKVGADAWFVSGAGVS